MQSDPDDLSPLCRVLQRCRAVDGHFLFDLPSSKTAEPLFLVVSSLLWAPLSILLGQLQPHLFQILA